MKLRSLIVILAVIAVVCLFPAFAMAEETPAEPAAQEETAEIAPSDSVCHVRGDVDRDGKITDKTALTYATNAELLQKKIGMLNK